MFKQIILPILAVAAFIVVVGLASQGKLSFIKPTTTIAPKITTPTIKIEEVEITVEVADTNESRAKGLSNRTSLDEKSGMIFVFSENEKPVFWMKDTKIPLDIIWINDNKIVGINKNVPTEIGKSDTELTRYPAPSLIDHVLEVNAGFADKNNITIGQSLSGLEQL